MYFKPQSRPYHKGYCKALASALAPTDRVLEKAVLKLSTRMMSDHEFLEQIASIVVVALSLHYHPERSRTHYVNFYWDIVPLRTAKEYRQDRPAKERVNYRGKQRYMLELVGAKAELIANRPPSERGMLSTRRSHYLEQKRARLRSQGSEEDAMDDCHHVPLYFSYSKFADRGGEASVLFATMHPGIVACKYAAALGDIIKLMGLSDKEVGEDDYILYAIRRVSMSSTHLSRRRC